MITTISSSIWGEKSTPRKLSVDELFTSRAAVESEYDGAYKKLRKKEPKKEIDVSHLDLAICFIRGTMSDALLVPNPAENHGYGHKNRCGNQIEPH
jgi:hypothetical protein